MDEHLEQLTELITKRLFVEVEASGRHVHVTKEQAIRLFGHDLTPSRPLSQPGQYLAQERITVVGPKGKFDGVAVLGPCRSAAQVEISKTDGKVLGLNPPVRLSGEIGQTPGVMLVGPCGTVKLDQGVIIAQRHIHMSPEDAALRKIADGSLVRLRVLSERPVTFEQVAVRVSPNFRTSAHLDYDEANAGGIRSGDLGILLP